MKISLEDLAPCKKLIRFEEEASAVDEALKNAAKDVQRQVKFPGFRPGKAPLDRVEKEYGEDIEKEAKRQLISKCYSEAVKQHKLRVVGYPDIEEVQFGRGQQLIFTATVETAPEFEMPDYLGLPAQRERARVSDEDIEKALTALRSRQAKFESVARPAENGDIAVVNYTGSVDGKPLAEIAPDAKGLAENKSFWIEIKPEGFLPGFAEQLVGAAAGDKRAIEVQFPPDFPTSELAGQKASYEVEVVEVKERVLPEVNDEFAKAWGADSVEVLRSGVRADLQNELNSKQRRTVRNQLVKALLDKVQFELPESFVSHETRNIVYDIVAENQKRGVSKEIIEKEKEGIYSAANQTARERVKAAYLFGRIAEKEGIRVTSEDFNARISLMAQHHDMAPQKLLKELEKREALGEIEQQILHEKVVDFLQEHARIEDVEPQPQAQPENPEG